MRRITVMAAAAALLLAGCGSASTPTPAPASSDPLASLRAAASSAAALPKCSALFAAGKRVTVTGGQLQCLDPDGTVVGVAVQRCADGTHLGSVPASSGAPSGWFLAPGAFHVVKGELAADAAYGAAYRKCSG